MTPNLMSGAANALQLLPLPIASTVALPQANDDDPAMVALAECMGDGRWAMSMWWGRWDAVQ